MKVVFNPHTIVKLIPGLIFENVTYQSSIPKNVRLFNFQFVIDEKNPIYCLPAFFYDYNAIITLHKNAFKSMF